MQPQLTYFTILACSFIGPLLLSFDKKVAFYKKWKFLAPAMALPAFLYIVWDVYFTRIGVWSFHPLYISGIGFMGLPIEEVLFFFVVPYCCMFIYECVRVYFPSLRDSQSAHVFFRLLAGFLLIMGSFCYRQLYTFTTFTSLAVVILGYYACRRFFSSVNIKAFLVSYSIILVPFLLVNGFLTAIPVVIYNDNENLAFRIYTIPVEDIFYGMLLVFLNVLIFEKLRSLTN